jgi:hypothetical protein
LPEDSDEETLASLTILKGEALYNLGRIDEAETVIKDVTLSGKGMAVDYKRQALAEKIKKHKESIHLTKEEHSQQADPDAEKEKKLQAMSAPLKEMFQGLFSPEQVKELSAGLDKAMKNNLRLDFTNKEHLALFNELSKHAEGRLFGAGSSESEKEKREPVMVDCPRCAGTGFIECWKCNGEGLLRSSLSDSQRLLLLQSGTIPRMTETCDACYGRRGRTCQLCEGSGKVKKEPE